MIERCYFCGVSLENQYQVTRVSVAKGRSTSGFLRSGEMEMVSACDECAAEHEQEEEAEMRSLRILLFFVLALCGIGVLAGAILVVVLLVARHH
jgi:hypothetical protein